MSEDGSWQKEAGGGKMYEGGAYGMREVERWKEDTGGGKRDGVWKREGDVGCGVSGMSRMNVCFLLGPLRVFLRGPLRPKFCVYVWTLYTHSRRLTCPSVE